MYRPLQTLLRSPVGNPGAPRVYHPQQIVLRSPTPCAGVTPAQRVLRPMIERHSIPGNPVRPQAHVAPQYSRGKSAPIQRMRDDSGKRVLEELTSPSWQPLDKENTWRGKKAITGAELNTLLRGAAIAAWKTYAFHATKSSNAESILTQGLDPSRGGTGASAGNATFQEHSRGHVHYTRKLDLASDYQIHFEGRGEPFSGRRDPSPEAAEILQVVIPNEVVEENDPDTPLSDRAYRTRRRISGGNIRRTKPADLPPERRKGKKGRAEPLIPNANDAAWRDHIERLISERNALLSNMPSDAVNVLWDLRQRGLDTSVVLQTVIQALRSMRADEILEFTKEDWDRNPRVRGNLDATGNYPIAPWKVDQRLRNL